VFKVLYNVVALSSKSSSSAKNGLVGFLHRSFKCSHIAYTVLALVIVVNMLSSVYCNCLVSDGLAICISHVLLRYQLVQIIRADGRFCRNILRVNDAGRQLFLLQRV
jgi:hypothetical protein